ncbi:hypothetical protein HDU92_008843 [Lobulomyces angularis]|nr:hypothetical protein HDU92_008843 [Lobulomyces angularis]
MPLTGIKVLEFAGLAPGPFAGMILADFGAQVIRCDKIATSTSDVLARGKKSISINLKSQNLINVLKKKIIPKVDVVIDPYRPGVMEKLGLGPEILLKINPRLIYARITGFGQEGYYSKVKNK